LGVIVTAAFFEFAFQPTSGATVPEESQFVLDAGPGPVDRRQEENARVSTSKSLLEPQRGIKPGTEAVWVGMVSTEWTEAMLWKCDPGPIPQETRKLHISRRRSAMFPFLLVEVRCGRESPHGLKYQSTTELAAADTAFMA
jgi:hypothetical protein